jgi:hypothetical protein
MRNATMMMAALLALVVPAGAQQDEKDKRPNPSKSRTCEPCEIRAYLLNKDRATINIVGITALLVLDGTDGADVLVPLQVVTTKTGEKNALQSSRAPRELEGTSYSVSLITIYPEGSRESEAKDADRRLANAGPQEPDGKARVTPAGTDRSRFTLEGPYFKADLTSEQVGTMTCKATVRFTINGSMHTAKGFSCALSKGSRIHGASCQRVAAECQEVERHLKAGEMDKATIAVDRMSASLSEPCGEPGCDRVRHGCAFCCRELRAAISSGNREQALLDLDVLKARCSDDGACLKPESTRDGDRK